MILTDEQLSKVSDLSFEMFGRTDAGGLKLRWFRSGDLYYHVPGDMEDVQMPSGIWVRVQKYIRHSWEKALGPCYVLAMWQPPELSRDQWALAYGSRAPYPVNGEYRVIENVTLPFETPPTLAHSALVKECLRLQKERTFTELLEASERAAENVNKDVEREFGDWVDDSMTAFGNIPGSRSTGVSFGGI